MQHRFRRRDPLSRNLRFESLESRQLLTVTVNTLIDEADGSIDDGDVSLRDAIANAPAGETIDFSVTGTINLTLGQLVIFKNVTIIGPGIGPGLGSVTIDAAGSDSTPGVKDGQGSRIFLVNDFSSTLRNVLIAGLSLTNGDTNGVGGAIYSQENLTLDNVLITNNRAASGGGIYALGPVATTTTILNSVITQNVSTNTGGGVSVLTVTTSNSSTSLSIQDTFIGNNQASASGGGLWVFVSGFSSTNSLNVQISNSSFEGNTASSGGGAFFDAESQNTSSSIDIDKTLFSSNSGPNEGGGIYFDSFIDQASISDSTINSNVSLLGVGGISSSASSLQIANSTISFNTGRIVGGVRFAPSIPSVNSLVENSTVFGNTATESFSDFAGGLSFDHSSDTQVGGTLRNTIVAGNTVGQGVERDIAGTVFASYNLIQSTSGYTVVGSGNILGTDPLLGLLQGNGGETPTHELLPGSPAIDHGDPSAVAGVNNVPAFDQRGTGFLRVDDGDGVGGARIDIGAFEVVFMPAPVISADFDEDGDVDGKDLLTWQRGYGTPSPTLSDGDADCDNDVDGDDLTIWADTYGTVLGPLSESVDFSLALSIPSLAILFYGETDSEPKPSYAEDIDLFFAQTQFQSESPLVALRLEPKAATEPTQGRASDDNELNRRIELLSSELELQFAD